MKAGDIFTNVPCQECGDILRTAVMRKGRRIICNRCMNPEGPSVGNGFQGHYEDDPSGASGSWDSAVKQYEENQ